MTTRGRAPATDDDVRNRRVLAGGLLLLAGFALSAPLFPSTDTAGRLGFLMIVAGVAELLHGFRRAGPDAQRAAQKSGTVTVLMGALVLGAGAFVASALTLVLAAWFFAEAARRTWQGLRRDATPLSAWLPPVAGNVVAGVLLLALRHWALPWTLAVAAALRIAGTAWNVVASPVHTAQDSVRTVIDDLGLQDLPGLVAHGERLEQEEAARAGADVGWVAAFVATLFAIHLGRMGFDRTALGVFSPAIAVLGDLFLAVVIAYCVIVPIRLGWRRLTRGVERRAWRYYFEPAASGVGRLLRIVLGPWLEGRLRFAVRLRSARYSNRAAVSRALQIGLPFAAIVAATVPVWGMSWYFDTENWASGAWNSWAESRTDAWREAMVRAVEAEPTAGGAAPRFAVSPTGTDGDFAFIVIGDTGEGDASQHVLRDQLIAAARQPDVRFVVLSSDVVYPTGAMRDYEAKFFLPFKGVDQPIYAIPGNHDWYDALEGFAATFLEPSSARTAMHARVAADHGVSSTTNRQIDNLIAVSARLRREYGVTTGQQQAPFFQVQTPRFALVAIDTGVLKQVDPAQQAWLDRALAESRGKLTMAVLGHPFYAGGRDQSDGNDAFAALRERLRQHGTAIVMAGDTHDLEYYAEPGRGGRGPSTAHHFVNGGGGAYLSFGTALAWPDRPATARWAYYPGRAQVVRKIDATTPLWLRPAWTWTVKFGAWPFSPEWLSAAFDANVAPFYQSFVEVRVEPSANRVRLLPYGVRGRLRWEDFDASADARPAGEAPDALVEWIVEMPTARDAK